MVKQIRRKILTFLFLFLGIGSFLGAFYWSTHSQKGFVLTWGTLVRLIPGKLEWERIDLNLSAGNIRIKNLRYTLPQGIFLLKLNELNATLAKTSLFRTRLLLENIKISNLMLDLSKLPPQKKKDQMPPLLRALSRRLEIKSGILENTEVFLKNGHLSIPTIEVKYKPTLLEKNFLQFALNQVQGDINAHSFSVQKIYYDGTFSVPDLMKEALLFRQTQGKLGIQGAEFGTFRLSDLQTQARFEGETLIFDHVALTFGKTPLLLNLTFAPFNQHAEGKLSTPGWVEFEDIPGFGDKLVRLYDKISFDLDFDITGFLFKEMEGKLALSLHTQGNQVNPKTPTLDLKLASTIHKGKFEFKDFTAHSERSDLAIKGFVDLAEMKLGVDVNTTGFDIKTLVTSFSEQDIQGYADAVGKITGPLKQPDLRFQGKAVESGYKFMRFGENGGDFEIVNGRLRYSGKSPEGDDTVEIVVDDIFNAQRRHLKLKTDFNQIDVSTLLENPGMKGKVSGHYEMDSFQLRKSGKLTANVKDFSLYQFHLGDVEAEGNLNNNDFSFPLITFQPPNYEKIKIPREALIHFDDGGFKYKGSLIEGMEIEGALAYAQKNLLKTSATCHECSIAPLLAALEFPPLAGKVDGKITMELWIGNFENSRMDANITALEVPVGESGILRQASPLKITYHQGAFHLDDVNIALGEGRTTIKGTYASDKPFNLEVLGKLDLSLLQAFKAQIREASGPADVNLKIRGTAQNPEINGKVVFEGASLNPRFLGNAVENLKGTLIIEDKKISAEDLSGTVAEGDIHLSGSLWHEQFKINKADIKADLREVALSQPGAYTLYLSGKVNLTGQNPNLLLAGNLDITEGQYTKNFEVKDFIAKPSATGVEGEKDQTFENLKLDLKIRSPGELQVKNNVATIDLKSDLKITGTKSKPIVTGAIEVLDGKFHYFRLNFENAKGVIDFRDPNKPYPYVSITADKAFDRPTESVLVNLLVEGYTDNLQLSFNSNPPLEKQEILALVFTGALPNEQKNIPGANIASTVIASQLTSVLAGPLNDFAHLDIFRLEASDPDSQSLTSLVVGKQIGDRLSLEFKTDLAVQQAVSAVQAEYLIFDNFLLKASRTSSAQYRLEATLRFKEY